MLYELMQNTSSIQNSLGHMLQKTPLLADVTFDITNINGDAIILSVLGITVVFIALFFLFFIFNNLAKIVNYKVKRGVKTSGKDNEDIIETESEISGETTAAISAALAFHFRDVHDFEHTVITIKRVQKRYSPWSSKIYGLREYPKK